MALKEEHRLATWSTWPAELALRDPLALAAARARLADTVAKHKICQVMFFRQWAALRRYANQRGVRVIGDIPIFVAYDSADVWGNPELFFLDAKGKPTVVAGVPPDYFSASGQLWGQPALPLGPHGRARLRLVDRAAAHGVHAGRRAAHRPLHRHPPLLGGPGARQDRHQGPLPAGSRRALPRRGARGARRPADHRRGPGRADARGGGAARPLRPARHEGAAVRLRQRRDQPVPAAQLPEALRRLHRHARQRPPPAGSPRPHPRSARSRSATSRAAARTSRSTSSAA